jgi:AraC-like DNA-binding protein
MVEITKILVEAMHRRQVFVRRRCNPDGPSIEAENAGLVAKACRIIEESEEEPSLEELAHAIGRSPSYFHRVFKAVTGLTPKDYAAAHPCEEGSSGTGLWQHRHRGDVRRRIQFERALL